MMKKRFWSSLLQKARDNSIDLYRTKFKWMYLSLTNCSYEISPGLSGLTISPICNQKEDKIFLTVNKLLSREHPASLIILKIKSLAATHKYLCRDVWAQCYRRNLINLINRLQQRMAEARIKMNNNRLNYCLELKNHSRARSIWPWKNIR